MNPVLVPSPVLLEEQYLLRDEFLDLRAVGGVATGQLATPGPGTRWASDAYSKMSIGSSGISLTGRGSWGSPGYALQEGVARVVGQSVIGLFTSSFTMGNVMEFGWNSAKSGTVGSNSNYVMFGDTDQTYIQSYSGSTASRLGNYVTATPYYVCLVLRASGHYLFIKGGAYTNWTLLWASGVGATATLYPFVTIKGNNENLIGRFIRVPKWLWLPIPYASDSFNRADGVLGSTDGAGHPEANGGDGLAWTVQLGTSAISSSKATFSALDGTGIAIATVPTGSANVIARVTATRSAGTVGMCLRYVDSNNYLLVQHDGTNFQLIERVDGVNTTRITSTGAIGAGGFVCDLSGASARIYLNDVIKNTYSGLVNTTATMHGIFTTDTGNTLDDFVIFARGNEGQYSILGRWIK